MTDTLPPLPEPTWGYSTSTPKFSAAQMHAYALAALDQQPAFNGPKGKTMSTQNLPAVEGPVDCRVSPLADALASLCRQLAERAEDDAETPLLLTVARATALVNALADAPSAIMDTRSELAVCAEREEDFPALYALQGRRVLLVDLEQP